MLFFLDPPQNKVNQLQAEKADRGRSAHYAPVRLAGPAGRPGDVLSVRALRREGQVLVAEAAA